MDNSVQSFGDIAMSQGTAPALTGKLGGGANVDKASQDFEAMFMSQMLQPMFDGVGTDPLFGGGHGEEMMKTFLVQEYGKIAAKSGHLGIAAMVKNEMIKAQSVGGKPATNTNKGGSDGIAQ
jgi:Rod binding domain-containing protein